MMMIAVCVGVITIYLVIITYIKLTRASYKDQPDMTNKTVIVTGASSGVGYETALGLAARNARVILACRNEQKALACRKKIVDETGNEKVVFKKLDLISFKSIRRFVSEINAEEARIDVLINNAAVLAQPYMKTEDGLEPNFCTNYFGPFLLTNLLLDKLKQSGSSRVVNVTSVAHSMGHIDFDTLTAEKPFGFTHQMLVYGCTKLAVVLFTREMSRRLHNTAVTVNCLEPGSVYTPLYKDMPFIIWLPLIVVGYIFFRTPEEGAQTPLYCAMSEDLIGVTGQYFSECRKAEVSSKARDDDLAKKLWALSEKITKLKS